MLMEYIYFAVGFVVVGIVLTFVVLGVCVRLGMSIEENIWVLAIPAVLSLTLNITLLELYHKYKKK